MCCVGGETGLGAGVAVATRGCVARAWRCAAFLQKCFTLALVSQSSGRPSCGRGRKGGRKERRNKQRDSQRSPGVVAPSKGLAGSRRHPFSAAEQRSFPPCNAGAARTRLAEDAAAVLLHLGSVRGSLGQVELLKVDVQAAPKGGRTDEAGGVAA